MELSDERLSRLSPAKRALLEARLRRQRPDAIAPWPHADWAPASFGQARFWLLDRLDPGTPDFNSAYAIHMRGRLDCEALRRALELIVHRHEPLRTTYTMRDDEVVQVIHPPKALDMPCVDLREASKQAVDRAYQQHAHELARLRFDLERGPVLHHRLVRRSDDAHTLLLTVHHIAFDRWSAGVMLDELMQGYDALAAGRTPHLPALPIRYADQAAHHRHALAGPGYEQLLAWWKQALGDDVPVLELPTDRPRAAAGAARVARRTATLPPDLLAALKAVGIRLKASLFHVLLGAFATVLHRYTQQDEFAIGVPIAGRDRMETQRLIGLLINTLPMRQRFDPDMTFAELVGRVRRTSVDALAHGGMPFERLVEVMRPQRDTDHMPLTQVLFNLHNVPMPHGVAGDVRFEIEDVEGGLTQFDMTMLAREVDDGLYLSVTYNAALFDADRIGRMLGHYETLLRAAVEDATQPVNAMPMLTRGESKQIDTWNTTASPLVASSVLPLIAARMRDCPDAHAIEQADRAPVTYAQLDVQATAVAARLQASGVTRGDIVGLFVERSSVLIAGMLGIWRAGGVLLPLDPAQPVKRLAGMCANAHVNVVLTHDTWRDRLEAAGTTMIDVEAACRGDATTVQLVDPTPMDRAYVIYTSGSTGEPKGAINTHGGLVNEIAHVASMIDMRPQDRALQVCAIGFDGSLEEILTTLISGATLVLRTDATPLTGRAFSQFLDAQRISIINVPTALWHAWISELDGQNALPTHLRLVVVGGEKASTRVYRRWLTLGAQDIRWINTYGPTETAIIATAYEPARTLDQIAADRDVPIGMPITNTRIHIVNDHMQPVPVGVAGELCIAGLGVGEGYLNDPQLTAARFVPDPFVADDRARMYSTGDRARRRGDGQIEFLGRIDGQVKLRGFRVEPGDIEAAISRLADVDQAAVLVDDAGSERRLVAYIAHGENPPPSAASVHERLRAALPAYMLPGAYVMLPRLPLTSNGKLDRRALPAADKAAATHLQASAEPGDDIERRLVELWRDVLGTDHVGIRDSFFDLGGHSLLAVRLFARIGEAFGVQLPLSALFDHDTIAELAPLLRRGDKEPQHRGLAPMRP